MANKEELREKRQKARRRKQAVFFGAAGIVCLVLIVVIARGILDLRVEEQAAMAAVTCNAARAMGLEEEWGTLAPGMRADLVLLDGSPLRLATAVRYTFIGGQKVYER